MNRLTDIFSGNKKALIVFDCAGAPDMAVSAQRIEEIIRSGADIIELGIPFSDPMADGAAIQEAYQTALLNGADLSKILAMIKTLRTAHPEVGFIVSGYCNIFLQYNYDKLFAELAALEIDALRILDLPCEEYAEIAPYSEKYNVKIVISVSKTTTPERLEKMLALPGSIIYCDNAKTAATVKAQTSLPIALNLDNSFDAVIVDNAAVKTPCGKLGTLIKEYKNKL